MYHMLHKCSIWNVAKVFFEDPENEFSLAEIGRKCGLAHTSVLLHLKTLENEELIIKIKKKIGKRLYPFYKANRSVEIYKHYKFISVLDGIFKSNLIEYIKTECMPDCIVLFGSCAIGEDDKSSDIDIYVQSKEKSLNLSSCEKVIGRKIELHFREDFNKYAKELKNNIINGIILYGYLDVFK